MELEKTVSKGSYPGFEILEELNVIYVMRRQKETKKFIGHKCNICYEYYAINYNISNGKDLDNKVNNLTNYSSLPTKCFDDISKINEQNLNYPVKMMCCGNVICHKCVKDHLFEQTSIVCMFCKIDHSIRTEKYVRVIVPVYNNFNTKSWINWWKQNDRINLLAF
jgi:hypothetical protein